jgi:tryptophan-rich sensory protein/uncharacterized protein YbjT (DUF2867 family)
LARRPEYLRPRAAAETAIVRGDVLDPASLAAALAGVATAYYLVHSMDTAKGFESADRLAAGNFAAAAAAAGVKRIIYLGGLGESSDDLSPHLRSRQEVGEVLRSSGVPVIEFRASIVIGSGSLSFEMIRTLVERLPVMITPRWVSVTAQPIAIGDLLDYLLAALQLPAGDNRVYEIGGADRVSYGDLMREYARQRGLRRFTISVPVLTPRLSSLWLGLVTPLYARVGRILIESIRHPTVVCDRSALETFAIRPMGMRDAVMSALHFEEQDLAQTRWSDTLARSYGLRNWVGVRLGTRIVDTRTARVRCSPEEAFAPIRRIGGRTGWYYGNWLWTLRGMIDLVIGGVGVRRGRRDPERLCVGDVVDFWRVEAVESDRRLRLVAEMKLPGRAWLEFEVAPEEAGSLIRLTAIFDPWGLFGIVYWYALYPIHQLLFAGMLRRIAAACGAPAVGHETQRPWTHGYAALALFMLLCMGVGALGAMFTRSSVETWYHDLNKPAWSPPDWLFGPVWTVLYLCMAVAGWSVWQASGGLRRRALTLFGLQLVLNLAWSPIFFGLRQPGWAAVEIVLLWLAIGGFMLTARTVSRGSALLFVPYWLWTTFAAGLNFTIWKLNVS